MFWNLIPMRSQPQKEEIVKYSLRDKTNINFFLVFDALQKGLSVLDEHTKGKKYSKKVLFKKHIPLLFF